MKVLLIKLSSLGDIAHTLPVLADIRANHPDAQIDWVVDSQFASLLKRCSGLRRILPCSLRRWKKTWWNRQTYQEIKTFKQTLQMEAYDAVIDLQGLSKSALIAAWSRRSPAGQRYAMARATAGSSYERMTRWPADRCIDVYDYPHALTRSRALCALALGYSIPTASPEPVFHLRAQAGSQAIPIPDPYSEQTQRPLISLIHGSSAAIKHWPTDHWLALGRLLIQSGWSLRWVSGKEQEWEQSQQWADHLGTHAQAWPLMSLDQLVDHLASCQASIGVDSGPSHIATALGLPHVQIYNLNTAWRTGPLEPPKLSTVNQVSVIPSNHQKTPDVHMVWQAWQRVVPSRPSSSQLRPHA
jgi:heptosyltransferase-1